MIIDLRLYDGSGLDLLAEAVTKRLLLPECAVILASHDFTVSRDSISPRTALDLDAFLDRLVVLALETSGDSRCRGPAHSVRALHCGDQPRPVARVGHRSVPGCALLPSRSFG